MLECSELTFALIKVGNIHPSDRVKYILGAMSSTQQDLMKRDLASQADCGEDEDAPFSASAYLVEIVD